MARDFEAKKSGGVISNKKTNVLREISKIVRFPGVADFPTFLGVRTNGWAPYYRHGSNIATNGSLEAQAPRRSSGEALATGVASRTEKPATRSCNVGPLHFASVSLAYNPIYGAQPLKLPQWTGNSRPNLFQKLL